MANVKTILAFDTALNGCIVAVSAGGKTVTRELPTDREQAAKLVPLIQDAMAEAGVAFADLDLIVTTVGPGSFTGLRISLSTARSFGLSLNIPVHGLSSLAVMAASCYQQGDTQNSLILLETKRQDFYVQLFDAALNPVGEAICASTQTILDSFDLSNVILCGDSVERFVSETGLNNATRTRSLLDPAILASYGAQDFTARGNPDIKPQPVYLRGADVSISTKLQREIQDFPL